jgi:hypothetical protein
VTDDHQQAVVVDQWSDQPDPAEGAQLARDRAAPAERRRTAPDAHQRACDARIGGEGHAPVGPQQGHRFPAQAGGLRHRRRDRPARGGTLKPLADGHQQLAALA